MKTNTTDKIVSQFFNTFRVFKQKLDYNNPIYQLPMAQMEALRFIDEKTRALMKDLADFLAITPPSATVLINNLVKLGYVQRNFDKRDRRTIHLSLTKKGQKVLHKGINQRCEKLKELLDNLNTKEQSQFLQILSKMNK